MGKNLDPGTTRNISKMRDFDVFSLMECKKRKSISHGKRKKMTKLSAKFVRKNA